MPSPSDDAAMPMLIRWYDGRSGAQATERRLWRLVATVREMSPEEVELLDDEVERLCKDIEEAAAAMRGSVATVRKVAALRATQGRSHVEAAAYRAKALGLLLKFYGDESRWPAWARQIQSDTKERVQT